MGKRQVKQQLQLEESNEEHEYGDEADCATDERWAREATADDPQQDQESGPGRD